MADNRHSSIPRLPPEIFRQIIQHLAANSDLLSVSLVSSILRDEAHRILFRHPSQILLQENTHPLHKPHERPGDKYPAFINAISLSPDRLGPLVRTYIHRERDNVRHEYLEMIKKALCAMTNLKRLAFLHPHNLPTSVLRGCTFQLDVFNWGRQMDALEILQDFLPNQPSLKHLTFPCHGAFSTEETIVLAASVCPQLKSLTGSRDAIDLFLKGRKVTYLQWDTTESNPSTTWFTMGPPATPKPLDDVLDNELAQVQYLTYIPSQNHQLPELLEKLHSLVLLDAPMSTLVGENNLILLSKLPTLRVLIMRAASPLNASQLDFVRDILTCCPQLLHVDLEIHAEVYQRFTQSSLASTPVRGVILTESAIYDSDSESCSQSDPDPNSYACAFASMSAFDGPRRLPSSIDPDLSTMFAPNDINFERDFAQWFQHFSALPNSPLR